MPSITEIVVGMEGLSIDLSPEFGGGKYQVTFRPTVAGYYEIDIKLGSEFSESCDKLLATDGISAIGGLRPHFDSVCLHGGVMSIEDWPTFTATSGASFDKLRDSIQNGTSPFKSTWLPTSIDAAQCAADGVEQVTAGESSIFQITARDQWGNDRTTGGDEFSIELTGPPYANPDPSQPGVRPEAQFASVRSY